jgi:dGTPase
VGKARTAPSLRVFREPARDGDDRDVFQHDRDIILYSSALQRLSTTTQVVSGESGYVFHNRLTHTLQVAQVGRRLAEKLNIHQKQLATQYGVNPDVVEAACLAHDIGHPPFGHLAEVELNSLVQKKRSVQGFEGNAQSFRIVTALAFRSEKFLGLNLTKRTLRAILKYPWTYSGRLRPKAKPSKWGAYDSELQHFEEAVGKSGYGPFPRSAEAELMDWADDLTYAIHDAEDFYRAGLIPLHLLRPAPYPGAPNLGERERFLQYVADNKKKIPALTGTSDAELSEILEDILGFYFFLSAPYQGTREDRGKLRSFTSQLVNRYINGIWLIPIAKDGRVVKADINYKKEIALLKQLTWYYVIDAPGLALQQHAQRRIIDFLYEVFLIEAQKSLPSSLLPPYYRERLRLGKGRGADRPERVVIDLIAGMTESRAILTYRKLKGIEMPTGLDRTVV